MKRKPKIRWINLYPWFDSPCISYCVEFFLTKKEAKENGGDNAVQLKIKLPTLNQTAKKDG